MRATILEGVKIAVHVRQDDPFLSGFDVQEAARRALTEVRDLHPITGAFPFISHS